MGRSGDNVSGLNEYQNISIEINEFSSQSIQDLKENQTNIFAYLNVGSLENYRDYYEEFKHLTFLDYDNWPDERWINVTDQSWQDFVVDTLAKNIKDTGAYGVYMDNVDVYSVFVEQGLDSSACFSALTNIIKKVSELGLKVMLNGGAEFIDDALDKSDSVFDSVYAYHQEEVFSLIEDYEKNFFGKQTKEDREYYQEISSKMKAKNKQVFYLEYSNDNSLISSIDEYCSNNSYFYYVSSSINLD